MFCTLTTVSPQHGGNQPTRYQCSSMELAKYKSVRIRFRVALKARGSRVLHGILRLVVTPEPLESPSSRAFKVRISNHHVNSFAIAFENDSILLLSFAQLVHDDRAIPEVTR